MKKWVTGWLVGSALLLGATAASANTVTQFLSISVSAINQISVSGSVALAVRVGAGQREATVSDSSTTYSVTTNERDMKIMAALNADMPAGTALTARLEAPAGAVSTGDVALTSRPQDVVVGINERIETGKTITYQLSASAGAGNLTTSRYVIYTIMKG